MDGLLPGFGDGGGVDVCLEEGLVLMEQEASGSTACEAKFLSLKAGGREGSAPVMAFEGSP